MCVPVSLYGNSPLPSDKHRTADDFESLIMWCVATDTLNALPLSALLTAVNRTVEAAEAEAEAERARAEEAAVAEAEAEEVRRFQAEAEGSDDDPFRPPMEYAVDAKLRPPRFSPDPPLPLFKSAADSTQPGKPAAAGTATKEAEPPGTPNEYDALTNVV